jgi:hypothetical protein
MQEGMVDHLGELGVAVFHGGIGAEGSR